jgi:hypothetical protein
LNRIRLRFGASWDTWLGRAVTVLTIALLFIRARAAWLIAGVLAPTVGAWVILMASAPATVALAEEAFVRLHPPLINPGGIVPGPGGMVTVYGVDLGGPKDRVRVLVNDAPVETIYHSPNQIVLRLPSNSSADNRFAVEVNSCRGNEFLVNTAGHP